MKLSVKSNQCLGLVKEIAHRMDRPEWVKETTQCPLNHNSRAVFKQSYWDDLSIAGGYAGILPLFTELDHLFPNEGWDQICHAYILKIKEAIESTNYHHVSMFGGLAGICFYIQQASKEGSRYQKLLSKLNMLFADRLEATYLFRFRKQLQASKPSPMALYDAIQGLAGIGLYCLKNLHTAPFPSLVGEVVQLLVTLTYPIEIEGEKVPGWYVPQEFQFLEEEKDIYPKGNFNIGLSHGISGVLAFLSIALHHGIRMSGQIEAIHRIVDWLIAKQSKKNGHLFWRARISFEEEIGHSPIAHLPNREAWCYGTPGVARSLFLAGSALKNETIKQFAVESFSSLFSREPQDWLLPGPTFCHGISGLLMLTHLMARDTQSSFLKTKTHVLKELLLDFYLPDSHFGFQDADPTIEGDYVRIERPGLLEGAVGVLLTLLSLESNSYSWHFPFLIDF